MKYEMTDVINAKRNTEDGFENLYKCIYRDLYKMAFYIMGNREQAEDVVSETVMDAYKSIGKLKEESKFEQWIIKILTTKCKRKMKEKYEKITVYNPNVMNFENIHTISQDAGQKEEKTDLQMAFEILSRTEKIIVTLCVVEGYKSREVGKMLSMNPSTVRSKLNRGLEKMRKYMEVQE